MKRYKWIHDIKLPEIKPRQVKLDPEPEEEVFEVKLGYGTAKGLFPTEVSEVGLKSIDLPVGIETNYSQSTLNIIESEKLDYSTSTPRVPSMEAEIDTRQFMKFESAPVSEDPEVDLKSVSLPSSEIHDIILPKSIELPASINVDNLSSKIISIPESQFPSANSRLITPIDNDPTV